MSETALALLLAGISALVAVGIHFLTSQANWQAEKRSQYREMLRSDVTELGVALHEVVACATVAIYRAEKNQSTSTWIERTKAACDRVGNLRLKVKYPLWDIDDGLKAIARTGGWLAHNITRSESRGELVAAAENLRDTLDAAISEALLNGEPPNDDQQKKVKDLAATFRKVWDKGHPEPDPEE